MPIPVPISGHDEPLSGDKLTTVRFNYEWRRLVVELLFPLCFDSFWSGAEADVQDAVNKAKAMIESLYDAGIGGGELDYIGTLVGRTTALTITNVDTVVNFDSEIPSPLHDVGDFLDPASPNKLVVPGGLDGYYHIFAMAQATVGTPQMFLKIKHDILGIVAAERTTETGFVTLAAAVTMFAAVGDAFSLAMRVNAGTRDIVATADAPIVARLGLFRVGDAP